VHYWTQESRNACAWDRTIWREPKSQETHAHEIAQYEENDHSACSVHYVNG